MEVSIARNITDFYGPWLPAMFDVHPTSAQPSAPASAKSPTLLPALRPEVVAGRPEETQKWHPVGQETLPCSWKPRPSRNHLDVFPAIKTVIVHLPEGRSSNDSGAHQKKQRKCPGRPKIPAGGSLSGDSENGNDVSFPIHSMLILQFVMFVYQRITILDGWYNHITHITIKIYGPFVVALLTLTIKSWCKNNYLGQVSTSVIH